MERIVDVHYPGLKKALLQEALEVFFNLRDVPGLKKKPSTSELLDWLKLLLAEDISPEALRSQDKKAFIPPLHGALLKNEQDVHLFERVVFMAGAGRWSRFIEPVTLRGAVATLEPLSSNTRRRLALAAADGELWRLWYTSVAPPDRMHEYVATALDMRERLDAMPFVVRDNATGDIVGCTRYFNVDAANRRVEIGHTWYARRVQRTSLNTECKLLLLTHAFEALRCIAVEFRTHWFNHASRTAIARLGAKQDARAAQSPADAGRREARHRGVLDHRQRMAGGAAHLRFQLDRPR